MELNKLIERRSALLAEADEILGRNPDTLEGDDAQRYDAIKTELTELRPQIEREERRAVVLRAAGNPDARVSGDGATSPRGPEHLRRVDAWGSNSTSDIQSRALKATEQMRFAEHADESRTRDRFERLLDEHEDNPALAHHLVKASNPEYGRAFRRWLKNPATAYQHWSDEQRHLMDAVNTRSPMSLTDANGGYMVPPAWDVSMIVLTNNGVVNPIRQLATIKSTTTDTLSFVTSAGVTAEWLGEATEVADASPSFGAVTATPAKGAAYLQASFELLADSGIASDVGMLIADARARLENSFVVGTSPFTGVVNAVGAVTASRVSGSSGAAGAADFVVADVYALINALPPRYRPNCSWLAEFSIYNQIRQFGVADNHAMWVQLAADRPALLLGRPAYESSAMESTSTVASGSNDDILLLGDFRAGLVVVDRLGTSISYVPHVFGSNRRPTGEAGFFAHFRTTCVTVDPNALRLLRI